MKTPWFMHIHRGVNTLVGVYPTPHGVFVRSWEDGVAEVAFYPMEPATRVVTKIITASVVDEDEIDRAVSSHLLELRAMATRG